MKITLLLAVLLLSGCGTLDKDLAKGLPKGTWKDVTATVTGKFSATKITAVGVINDGKVITAEELHIRHSNVWVPLIEIDAVGYTKPLKP